MSEPQRDAYYKIEVVKENGKWRASSPYWYLNFTTRAEAERAKEIIRRAYGAGRAHTQEDIRRALGVLESGYRHPGYG